MTTLRAAAMLLSLTSLLACTEAKPPTRSAAPIDNADATAQISVRPNRADNLNTAYTTIEWTDLIPKEDLEALLNPPEYLQNIEDGSEADKIDGQIKAKQPTQTDDRYQLALASQTIKPEYNNRAVRIPGFIVPLEFNSAQTITTFFLVPFFGACLHMPPPPPNQIIYAEYEPGIKLEALYDPFWVQGTLSTTLMENHTATAAYTMTADSISPYEDED